MSGTHSPPSPEMRISGDAVIMLQRGRIGIIFHEVLYIASNSTKLHVIVQPVTEYFAISLHYLSLPPVPD